MCLRRESANTLTCTATEMFYNNNHFNFIMRVYHFDTKLFPKALFLEVRMHESTNKQHYNVRIIRLFYASAILEFIKIKIK